MPQLHNKKGCMDELYNPKAHPPSASLHGDRPRGQGTLKGTVPTTDSTVDGSLYCIVRYGEYSTFSSLLLVRFSSLQVAMSEFRRR